MPEYTYINEAEREWTQKYEGTYTPEEIKLNKQLYEECSKEVIDLAKVEDLLKQGADPLGGTEICGWDLLEHIYGELVYYSEFSNSVNIPKLTELFLKYGMNIEAPRIPYDGDFSLNPLWDFIFSVNEYNGPRELDQGIEKMREHGIMRLTKGRSANHVIQNVHVGIQGEGSY